MPHRTSRRSALALIVAFAAGAAIARQPRGTFGFVAKVDADGIFNPTLKSAFVQSVQPGMPAAIAGVVAGDSIVEVEGIKVAGASASTMAERMKKKPGETLILRLLRANGETYLVTLTAVAAKS
jgi:C-terminal processing protease CtpA/Prc